MKKLLPALLGLLLLAGCGSDTEESNTYVRQLNAAQTTFTGAVTRVSRETTSADTARARVATLRRFERAIDRVVADLRAISVPGTVQPEHDRLVRAMLAFGREISKAGATLRGPTRSALDALPGDLRTAEATVNRRINSATAAINTKLGTG